MKPWLLVSIALVLLALTASLVVFVNRDAWLPEQVPTHWNASGIVDRLVPRDDMLLELLVVPGLMGVMLILALILPWLSPLRYKIEPFRPTYDYIMALVITMFAGMHVVLLLAFTESIHAVDRWITCVSLLGIMALGNVLGKVQPNFFIGIRTPWTIASEVVWMRTHRLAAWLFVLGGLVGFILVLVGVPALIAMSICGVALIAPVFYSLWLYKRLEKQGRLGEQQ
jgi:uncharacterized membrane protein